MTAFLKTIDPDYDPNKPIMTRCDAVRDMKELKHCEIQNAANMVDEIFNYMIDSCQKLEHVNFSNNPNSVGVALTSLLENDPKTNHAWFPELKHLTFWDNATVESPSKLKGGSSVQDKK